MKVWYYAVCDKCKEAAHVMVSNPGCSNDYLGKYDVEIQAWLQKHYGCELRLVWRDDQLDKLFENKGEYKIFRWFS